MVTDGLSFSNQVENTDTIIIEQLKIVFFGGRV